MTGSAERRRTTCASGAPIQVRLPSPVSIPKACKRAIFDRNDRLITAGLDQRVLAWTSESPDPGAKSIELQSEPTSLAIGSGAAIVAGGRGGDVHAVRLRAGAATTTSTRSAR